jgi:hypothetical protein
MEFVALELAAARVVAVGDEGIGGWTSASLARGIAHATAQQRCDH